MCIFLKENPNKFWPQDGWGLSLMNGLTIMIKWKKIDNYKNVKSEYWERMLWPQNKMDSHWTALRLKTPITLSCKFRNKQCYKLTLIRKKNQSNWTIVAKIVI